MRTLRLKSAENRPPLGSGSGRSGDSARGRPQAVVEYVVKNLVVRFWRDEAAVVTAEYGWVAAGLSLATLVAAIAIATRFGHPPPF